MVELRFGVTLRLARVKYISVMWLYKRGGEWSLKTN